MATMVPFQGTAEEYLLRNLRAVEKLVLAGILLWAIWGPIPKGRR